MDKFKNKILHGDCLELLQEIPSKSVNLIVIDPPYNIGKDKRWDKYEANEYLQFMGTVFKECERILKENGSFYWFHNDMVQIKDLMKRLEENSNFIFKQFIVWNKRFDKASNKGFLDGFVVVDGLRNFQQMAEYCLFYTFQDETGLTKVYSDRNNFKPIREYMQSQLKASGLRKKDINAVLGSSTSGGGMACHYFGNTDQWSLPTKDKWLKLQTTGYFQRAYESLRQEYESLRQEYESQRYTYNNLKTHHSVWNYEIAPKQGHVTPKPVEMIENIIKHSSNEGDIILDCFMGSGTTAIACINTNRFFIGMEREKDYVDIANERIRSLLERR